MPELPEIVNRARELRAEVTGREIASCDVLQPKVLNMPPERFAEAVRGARILNVTSRGKWILLETSGGWLLVNLGMGGEILLTAADALPAKRRLVLHFSDGDCLSFNFWWFGYVHHVPADGLTGHSMTAGLGPDVLEISEAQLASLAAGRRGPIKTLLMDQNRMAGIGNFYIHDILFLAGIHPLRKAESLTPGEIAALWKGIRDGLEPSLRKGGAWYETDLHGRPGGFALDELLVGYREGKPCPRCGSAIVKLRTGSNSSFVCPVCQPLGS